MKLHNPILCYFGLFHSICMFCGFSFFPPPFFLSFFLFLFFSVLFLLKQTRHSLVVLAPCYSSLTHNPSKSSPLPRLFLSVPAGHHFKLRRFWGVFLCFTMIWHTSLQESIHHYWPGIFWLRAMKAGPAKGPKTHLCYGHCKLQSSSWRFPWESHECKCSAALGGFCFVLFLGFAQPNVGHTGRLGWKWEKHCLFHSS